MFETLDKKIILSLGKIDDPVAFHELSENQAEMLECLNTAAIECGAQKTGFDNSVGDLQQVIRGLVSAQNIVNGVFSKYKDGEAEKK